MDCSLPGSSIHGIFRARILEWVAISFSRGSSWPRVDPGSSALQADSLPTEPLGKQNIPKYPKMEGGKNGNWQETEKATVILGETCSGILLATILSPLTISSVYNSDFQDIKIFHALNWIYLLDPILEIELYFESSLKNTSQRQITHLNIFSYFKLNVLCHVSYWQCF